MRGYPGDRIRRRDIIEHILEVLHGEGVGIHPDQHVGVDGRAAE